jgi:hypothetical protein
MSAIAANDLKTRGVVAIEALLATQPEAMISVRGKERLVAKSAAAHVARREAMLAEAKQPA